MFKELKRCIRGYRRLIREVRKCVKNDSDSFKEINQIYSDVHQLYWKMGFIAGMRRLVNWNDSKNFFEIMSDDSIRDYINESLTDYTSDRHLNVCLRSLLFDELCSVYDTLLNFLIKQQRSGKLEFFDLEEKNYKLFNEVKNELDYEIDNNYYAILFNNMLKKLGGMNHEAVKLYYSFYDYSAKLIMDLESCINVERVDPQFIEKPLRACIINSFPDKKDELTGFLEDKKRKYFAFYSLKKEREAFINSKGKFSDDPERMFL